MKRWSNTCKLVLGLLVVVGLSWQTVFRTISAIDGREGDSRKRAMQVTVKVKFREGENTNAHEESSVGSDQSSSELDSSISGHIDIAQRAQFSKKSILAVESELEPLPGSLCNFTGDCCKPYSPGDILVWDSFTFSGDWEMIQLRLGTLCNVAHQFVVLQANITFGGKAVDYAYANDSRIAPWVNCIRFVTVFSDGKEGHHVDAQVTSINSTSELYDLSPWPPMNERDAVEIWIRDHVRYGYVVDSKSLISVSDNDWVIFSDLDEISDPQAIQWLLKYFTGNPWFVLHFAEFAYGFWNRKADHSAAAASVVRGHMAKKYRMAAIYFHGRRGGSSESGKCRKARQPTGLYWATWNKKPIDTACMWKRAKIHPRKVYAAGWHCSNCYPSIERILRKLCSFKWMHLLLVQRGWNIRSFTSAVRSGRVVHSTSNKHMSTPYKRVNGFAIAPTFAKKHLNKFGFLMSPDMLSVNTSLDIANCDSFG